MVRTRIQPVLDWLKRVVTEPRTELTRWQRAVRFMIDLAHTGVRQLRTDQAPQMAGALAFRTLFSLLPVLVVGTVLVKAMMGPAQFETVLAEAATWTVEQLGVAHFTMEGEDGTSEMVRVDAWLHETIIAPAMKIEWRALGAVGVGVVIYAAIGLMVTIEKSFNAVLRAPEGRSWLWRITVYWTVLTVSPLAIALLIAIDRWFDGMIKDLAGSEGTGGWQWLLGTSNVVWSFGATWLFMTAVYKLVPNTTVRLRAALTGAFVAAILLEIGRRTMGAYIGKPLTVNLLYGSLGLIPLFMFWVYLMWLVVLLGLEVTACLQMVTGRNWHELERQRRGTGLVDPAAILALLEVAVVRFESSLPTTVHSVAEATGLPEAAVRLMLERLADEGIMHRVDRPEAAFALARPPARIDAKRVMEVGFALADQASPGERSPLLRRLRNAQRAVAERLTLGDEERVTV